MPTKQGTIMSIEKLVAVARLKMGATKKIRLAVHAERSRLFDIQAINDFNSQQLTPELLSKRCTL